MEPGSTKFNPIYSADPSFDFSKKVFEGIHREMHSPYDSDAEHNSPESSRGSSPLPSLTSSSASSRPSSPIPPAPRPATLSINASSSTNPAPQPPLPLTRKEKLARKAKKSSRINKKNKKARRTKITPHANLALKHLQNAEELPSTYSAQNFGIATTGYTGNRTKAAFSTYTLDQLVGPGSKFKNLKLKKWDGRTSMPIVEAGGLVIGVCAGVPAGDTQWDGLQLRAGELLENARPRLAVSKKDKKHRRGNFRAFNVGISHGYGQRRPKIRAQEDSNAPIFEGLTESDEFRRISGFQTGAFSAWAPRLYEHQNSCLDRLIENDPSLRRNFPLTPWAAAAFNFGPQTVCYKHADYGNLAFGWCAITALGRYDYTKGGHLILWDLGWVIEFPPGSTILIPSSAIQHSNARIQVGEQRYSFTQYSSGGLFRWAGNNFQRAEDYLGAMEPDDKAAVLEELANQLAEGLSLYSTLAELEAAKAKPPLKSTSK